MKKQRELAMIDGQRRTQPEGDLLASEDVTPDDEDGDSERLVVDGQLIVENFEGHYKLSDVHIKRANPSEHVGILFKDCKLSGIQIENVVVDGFTKPIDVAGITIDDIPGINSVHDFIMYLRGQDITHIDPDGNVVPDGNAHSGPNAHWFLSSPGF